MASKESVRPLTSTERVRAGVAYWLFAVACLAFSGAGWFLVHAEGTVARSTRPVPAVIERSEVISTPDAKGRSTRQPLVIYSYSVDNVRYTTSRIGSLNRSHGASWAEEMVERYKVGQKVTAYVSPADPGSAFLVEDRDWRAYAFAIVPLLVALGLAAYWPWSGLRTRADT